MLLIIFAPQSAPANPGFINTSLVVRDMWAPLNANSEADAIFWTSMELYEYIDEGAKRLARKLGAFVVRDESLASALGQGNYPLPAPHISTLQCDLNGVVLRPRTVQELEALDGSWPSTSAPPQAFLEDTQGLTQLTLYPKPDVSTESLPIGLVMQQDAPDISQAAAILSAPYCLRDYFFLYAMGEARAKESQGQMQETAQWFRGMVDQMEQAISEYWK